MDVDSESGKGFWQLMSKAKVKERRVAERIHIIARGKDDFEDNGWQGGIQTMALRLFINSILFHIASLAKKQTEPYSNFLFPSVPVILGFFYNASII